MSIMENHTHTVGLHTRDLTTAKASYLEMAESGRIDATFHVGRHSEVVRRITSLPHKSLGEMVSDGDIERHREQNLQVSAIGYSEKHDDARSGSYRLLEPNFISWDMSIDKFRYLACARRLRTIDDGAVLMSAEGSVGLVTIFREDPQRPTVSNIHAQSMTHVGRDRLARNCWLAASLVLLREKGVLDSVSAGGQGGSLGFNYHEWVPIPEYSAASAALLVPLIGEAGGSISDIASAGCVELRESLASVRHHSIAELDELKVLAESAARRLVAAYYPELG